MFRYLPQLMWDLTIHLLRGPASSLALVPFSNRCGTPQSTPTWDPTSLLAHRLVSTPLRGSASLLTHRPVSKYLKLTPSRCCPLWAFPFGLPLKVFKTHLVGRGFHTPIKHVLFFSPIDVESHRNKTFLIMV